MGCVWCHRHRHRRRRRGGGAPASCQSAGEWLRPGGSLKQINVNVGRDPVHRQRNKPRRRQVSKKNVAALFIQPRIVKVKGIKSYDLGAQNNPPHASACISFTFFFKGKLGGR